MSGRKNGSAERVSVIVTISPVIDIGYMNLLIHSLNSQSSDAFDVIFYNQTSLSEDDVFSGLSARPDFSYRFLSLGRDQFLGKYPLWDIYGFHQGLIDRNELADYHMSLHMEEFLDHDYIANAISVLDDSSLDILLGNMYSLELDLSDVSGFDGLETPEGMREYTRSSGIRKAPKWGLPGKPFFLTRRPLANIRKAAALRFGRQLKPTGTGFTLMNRYLLEDVFLMRTSFAERFDWYRSDVPLYFEDIHINWRLENMLRRVTTFPAYFNRSRVYHLSHGKYYYQIEDREFTDRLLEYSTDNEVLVALKEAVSDYRRGDIEARAAVRQARQTAVRLNVEFHTKHMKSRLPV